MLGPALLLFLVASLFLAWGEQRLADRPAAPWLALWTEWLLLPLGRVFCLLIFIACAYPALYGLREAPALGQLLAAEPGRLDRLINLLFFAGLLLPALPALRRAPGLVLPLQGAAGIALVHAWLAAARGLPAASPWPSAELALLLLALSGLAMAAAALLSRQLEDEQRQQALYSLLLLWLQLPVLLVYGQWLGRQLRLH